MKVLLNDWSLNSRSVNTRVLLNLQEASAANFFKGSAKEACTVQSLCSFEDFKDIYVCNLSLQLVKPVEKMSKFAFSMGGAGVEILFD